MTSQSRRRKRNRRAKRTPSPAPSRAPARTEQEIFDDLAKLCASPGFIHAIAFVCFRDNSVGFKDALTASDLAKMHSPDRLIRTEISTLIGLMHRATIDFALPEPAVLSAYIEQAEALLRELHDALAAPMFLGITPEMVADPGFNPFANAKAMREPIFYGGESAYTFQYRDFSAAKYKSDSAWLSQNKGVDPDVAARVVKSLANLLNVKQIDHLKSLRDAHPATWTMLPAFTFGSGEVAGDCNLPVETVESVLQAFSLPADDINPTFTSLSEYNATNAYPLIRKGDAEYVLLQYSAISEALYETPFYWMIADKSYSDTAQANRGSFAESFVKERLTTVFGPGNIHRGVRIFEGKGKEVGEIDVLVIFGTQVVVVQLKSKRLTIASKKGNDLQLKDDFKKAVQDASDQGYECAKAVFDKSLTFRDENGDAVALPDTVERVYRVCAVSDHYPSLNFQARQFLAMETQEKIGPHLVTDIFAIDAMAEMLTSPLRFLSYLRLRERFGDKFFASHEYTLLSYHLKQNLWLQGDAMMFLGDDISVDLDVAMAVRREGVPGAATPDGILTRLRNTWVGDLLTQLESNPNHAALGLGFLLLELSEETTNLINTFVANLRKQVAQDGLSHDATIAFGAASAGLTIHCNANDDSSARKLLASHCSLRKYATKAVRWFGLLLSPQGQVRSVLMIDQPWQHDAEMDAKTKDMRRADAAERKPGRNDPCPCGSGRKFKKCCLSS